MGFYLVCVIEGICDSIQGFTNTQFDQSLDIVLTGAAWLPLLSIFNLLSFRLIIVFASLCPIPYIHIINLNAYTFLHFSNQFFPVFSYRRICVCVRFIYNIPSSASATLPLSNFY